MIQLKKYHCKGSAWFYSVKHFRPTWSNLMMYFGGVSISPPAWTASPWRSIGGESSTMRCTFIWMNSSKESRDSMLVQIYLYKICIKEELGIDVKQGVIVNCTKQGKLNIKEFPINEMQEQVAISCLNIYRYLNQKGEK